MFRRILIAVDDTPPAADAAEAGLELAYAMNAEVRLLSVLPHTPAVVPNAAREEERDEHMVGKARRLLDSWRRRAAPPLIVHEELAHGEPAEEIVRVAKAWEADLIVVGTLNRRGVSRLLLGSTAQAVAEHAPGADQDNGGDQQAHGRVEPQPAREGDQPGRDHDAE